MKPGTLIIIVSMAIIAFCAGFVMTFVAGVPAWASVAISVAFLSVLAMAQLLVVMIAERRRLADQLNDLSETAGHCMRQVTAVTQRLDDLHSDVSERIDGETREMRDELTLVANAVRELADVVDDGPEDQFEVFDDPVPAPPPVAREPVREPARVAPVAPPPTVTEIDPIRPAPVAPPAATMDPIRPAPFAAPASPIPTIDPIRPTPVAAAIPPSQTVEQTRPAPAPAYANATVAAPVFPTASLAAPVVYAAVPAPAADSTAPDLSALIPDPGMRASTEPAAAQAAPVATQPAAAPEPAPAPVRQSPPSHRDFGAHALYSDAIKDGRVDMFLQPIVALPQRHVQFYEAITKVRTLTTGLVEPETYRSEIARHESIVDLDSLTLARALKISARLSQRGRSIQVFMPVGMRSLVSQRFITDAQRVLHDNHSVAGNLVLQIEHDDLAGIGPVEEDAMATLADAGPRFALNNARDFRFDPQDLARRRFRYIRIDVGTLFGGNTLSPDIHPADFSGLVQRFTMRLIATGVTQERTVPDLLDYHIPYALGDLFSVPRPVRSDILSDPDGTANARRASA